MTCNIDDQYYCYEQDEILSKNISKDKCVKSEHPLNLNDVDPEINVRAILSFPSIEKSDIPS